MEPSGICKESLIRTLWTKPATRVGVEELHNVQHAAVQACAIAAHERRQTEEEAVASFEQLRRATAERYRRASKSLVASQGGNVWERGYGRISQALWVLEQEERMTTNFRQVARESSSKGERIRGTHS